MNTSKRLRLPSFILHPSSFVLLLSIGCGGISRRDAMRAMDSMGSQRIHVTYTIDYLKAGRPFKLLRVVHEERVLDRYRAFPDAAGWRLTSVVATVDLQSRSRGARSLSEAVCDVQVRGQPKQPPDDDLLARTWQIVSWPGRKVVGLVSGGRLLHHERFRLRVQGNEAAEVLESLVLDGYFDQTFRLYEGVVLAVDLGGRGDKKNWGFMQELEALLDRARLEGTKLVYEQPTGQPLGRPTTQPQATTQPTLQGERQP